MQIIRFLLIIITLLIAAYFTIQVNMWIADYRDLFFYLGDWKSVIAIVAFGFAVAGIFKWFLIAEVKATRPSMRRRRR